MTPKDPDGVPKHPREEEKLFRASEDRDTGQAFLLKFSDRLRTLRDVDAMSNLAIESLAEQLKLDLCCLASIDVAADRAMLTHRCSRTEFPELPSVLRLSDFPTPFKQSLDRTVVVSNAANDPELTENDKRSLAAIKFGAFIASVVRHGERTPIWGTVAVSVAPRDWKSSDIALIEDVCERTWAAVERVRVEQTLRDANRRKDEFLAMLAHELRNPLAAIRNAVRIIARSDGDPRNVKIATDILDRQVESMVRQVDDLLDVSRISRNKIELRKERTDLVSIVNLAIEASRGSCERLGHELIVSLPDEPIVVEGDRIRLAQVVSNLLSNACKFTDKNGRIWLDLAREGAEAVIKVRDSGIGLAGDDLPKIFEMFSQVDRSLERTRDGLGLGLSLVKSLVEMHGGNVEARSDGLGRGSEFIVRLPLRICAAEPLAEAPVSVESMDLISRRVLVADDNRDSAASLALLLTMMGHEVDTANDGVEAVERAVAFNADFILLDIGMPGLNGYDAARALRKQHKDLTLVAMTGWGQEEDRRRSKEAGFDAHLVKPVDMAALQRLLGPTSQS